MKRLFFAALALFSTPALADTLKVQPNATYELKPEDQLQVDGVIRNEDVNKRVSALPRGSKGRNWPYAYVPTGGAASRFTVSNSAVLERTSTEGTVNTYALVSTAAADTTPVHQFRNGISLSNSLNGYIEDSVRFTSPYIFNGGIRSLRIPYRAGTLIANGTVAEKITLGGYATAIAAPLKKNVDLALANDVMVLLDNHEYKPYSDPVVASNNIAVGSWLMSNYGYNDNIVLEVQNESNGGGWEVNWATNLKNTVAQIRAAGITYKLAVSWGGWNSVGGITRAMTELDAIGGPNSIDPLNRLIFTGHHYPTTTGNDQPKSGQSAPQINGSGLNSGLVTFFDTCKARNLQCMETEIGFGGGARAWLANGSGVPAYNGKAYVTEYMAKQQNYAGNVIGTILWGGGSGWNDTYPFKIEYTKDGWAQTQGTDFWMTVKPFFAK